MSKLVALTQAQLDRCITQAQLTVHNGRLPEHIPLLANPDRCHEFAVQVRRVEQQIVSVAAAEYRFPLMSLIKPFVLLYVLQQSGQQKVLHYVDMKSSEHAFNSLAQLEIDPSKPRNPMINSGAIALAALLLGETVSSRCENLCRWLNQYDMQRANSPSIRRCWHQCDRFPTPSIKRSLVY